MLLLIIIAVFAIGFSFLCSVLEAVLLSITPSFIARQREDNPGLHASLEHLKANIDRPLAAILTLNTIAHTVGATAVGARAAAVFGESWVGAVSAVMTFLILVFSEIIPKTLGATHWKRLAVMLPPVLRVMTAVLLPFIWLSEQITRRLGGQEENTIDLRDEIKVLARVGQEKQVLDADETRTITNVLNLHEIPVSRAMTPRIVCQTVRPEMTVGEFEKEYGQTPFTRFPVMDEGEQAFGYVHKMDMYQADPDATMTSMMHPIGRLEAEQDVEQAFAAMLGDNHHMRAVYDAHGSFVGLITLEDVLETLLGQEIVDETDRVDNLQSYARQRWLQRIRQARRASGGG
ncbi:CNNM domain-containing protein [Halomonas piscis]|uniref:CNNM domain-containing protein n=1 Tax=Halomonas piscis TaxID=3031727 RepID=UPI00289FAF8B|nr:CNNM domain-containing protein [Halomonas piscis]